MNKNKRILNFILISLLFVISSYIIIVTNTSKILIDYTGIPTLVLFSMLIFTLIYIIDISKGKNNA
jgi:hypothetical protein